MGSKVIPIDGLKQFSFKSFFLGFAIGTVLFGGVALYQRFEALSIAWQYPEVVSQLEISKDFQVKK